MKESYARDEALSALRLREQHKTTNNRSIYWTSSYRPDVTGLHLEAVDGSTQGDPHLVAPLLPRSIPLPSPTRADSVLWGVMGRETLHYPASSFLFVPSDVEYAPTLESPLYVPVDEWVRRPVFTRIDSRRPVVYHIFPVPGGAATEGECLFLNVGVLPFFGPGNEPRTLTDKTYLVNFQLSLLTGNDPDHADSLYVSPLELLAVVPPGTAFGWTSLGHGITLFPAPSRGPEEIMAEDLLVLVDPELHGVRCLKVPSDFFSRRT